MYRNVSYPLPLAYAFGDGAFHVRLSIQPRAYMRLNRDSALTGLSFCSAFPFPGSPHSTAIRRAALISRQEFWRCTTIGFEISVRLVVGYHDVPFLRLLSRHAAPSNSPHTSVVSQNEPVKLAPHGCLHELAAELHGALTESSEDEAVAPKTFTELARWFGAQGTPEFVDVNKLRVGGCWHVPDVPV